MPWGAIASAVAPSLIGGLFGGGGSSGGMSNVAAVSREDAAKAAEMAKFKGYGVSSGFGKSMLDTETGESSYTLDPTLSAFRDQLYGLANQGIGGINMDTTQAAQNYYDQQQGLMAGGRGAEDIALRNQQLQSGRIGLGLSGASQGAGAGTGYVNPEQYQRDLARSQVNAQVAFDSQGRAREELDRDIARATGLFSGGTGIEQLGYNQMALGADISNMAAQAGGRQGQLYLGGSNTAAGYQADAYNARNNLANNLAGSIDFGGLFAGDGMASGAGLDGLTSQARSYGGFAI